MGGRLSLLLLQLACATVRGSRYWRVHTLLHGQELTCELSTSADGDVELLPEAAFGRGCGWWRCRESGVIEGQMQLYIYTMDDQSSEPTLVDVLCLRASPNELRGLLFDPSGGRLQIGALPPAPCVGALVGAHTGEYARLTHRCLLRHEPPDAAALPEAQAPAAPHA